MNFLEISLITVIILLLYTIYLYIGNYNNVVTQLENIKLRCTNIKESVPKEVHYDKIHNKTNQNNESKIQNNESKIQNNESKIQNNDPEISEFDENGDKWSYI